MEPTDKVSLTYEQLQALGAKMGADIGKAKVLTTADYNYPTDNPRTLALWLLEPGLYAVTPPSLSVTIATGFIVVYPSLILVGETNTSNKNIIVIPMASVAGQSPRLYTVNVDTGSIYTANPNDGFFVMSKSIIDNLTSTTTNQPLSANQGKVLNDKIGGDLSNLTTTDKTSLINAINEVAGQGGGGGGMIELTKADYNYDSDEDGVNDCVALWLLPPGTYYIPKGAAPESWISFCYESRYAVRSTQGGVFLVGGPVDSWLVDGEEQCVIPIVALGVYGAVSEFEMVLVNPYTGEPRSTSMYMNTNETRDSLRTNLNFIAYEAPTASTYGELGQLWTDISSTPIHTYQMTAVDETDPDNPVYTWTQRW